MKKSNIAILAFILLLAMGCANNTISVRATSTPLPTYTAKASSTVTQISAPKPTSTSTPLTAAEIFAQASPSIAFIETPIKAGSGLLIEDGYVVTNAHVVWPFQKVRVVFPDGAEFLNAPVLNWDLLGDLAIIGPLSTTIRPAELVNGENLAVGSTVFLLGYPGEAEQFPQPTITRALISRLREWTPIEMTYLQTDAPVAVGQSGGALVSEKGEIIGISGLYFSEARFGLSASAADILPRVQKLIAGEDVAGLGNRIVPLSGGQDRHNFTLQHEWDSKLYVINEPVMTHIDIALGSKNNAVLAVFDIKGDVFTFSNKHSSGIEAGSEITESATPYFAVLGQYSRQVGDFYLKSNHKIAPLYDVDDGTYVPVGQPLVASIDCPGDIDYFVVDLEKGDIITVTVSSIMIDPFFVIDFPQSKTGKLLANDNGGEGLFGQDARLTYTAPHGGNHFIVVGGTLKKHVGGYFLTVTPVDEPLF